jgi:ribonuclease D
LQPVHITDNAALSELAHALTRCDSIAVDTEFMRVDTFYPILGLLQIGDGQHEYLIDPLRVTDLSPLIPLLVSEFPRKVLHACSEDIEVLTRLAGAQPKVFLIPRLLQHFWGRVCR